jgi:hypothetical protein
MTGKVVPIRSKLTAGDGTPSAETLATRVHELASNSANLRFDHPHFQQRLIERKITMRQVLEVLRSGLAIGEPRQDEWGDTRIKLQRLVAGRRVQVVVAIKEGWLDLVTAI